MLNRAVSQVMVKAKKENKWVPVRCMVQYGLMSQHVNYLCDKGLLVARSDAKLGTLVKPTVEGYYQALALVEKPYNAK